MLLALVRPRSHHRRYHIFQCCRKNVNPPQGLIAFVVCIVWPWDWHPFRSFLAQLSSEIQAYCGCKQIHDTRHGRGTERKPLLRLPTSYVLESQKWNFFPQCGGQENVSPFFPPFEKRSYTDPRLPPPLNTNKCGCCTPPPPLQNKTRVNSCRRYQERAGTQF